MYGKDDRSKDNRKNMKQHNHHHKQQRRGSGSNVGTTSSSTVQTTGVRSIVDVADSSDEPRFAHKAWSGGRCVLPQKNRDILNTLPPMENEDCSVNGQPIDENACAQLRAGDYKQLSQFPSLGNGHFTYGPEKEWTSIVDGQTTLHTMEASSYFTLNVSLLGCGLRSIPFYKRLDYPTNVFTRQQISDMNEAAEREEHIYQQRILHECNGQVHVPSAKPKVTTVPPAIAPDTAEEIQPDELDELLSLTNTHLEQANLTPVTKSQQGSATSAVAATPTNKSDVEQWLDSVLEE